MFLKYKFNILVVLCAFAQIPELVLAGSLNDKMALKCAFYATNHATGDPQHSFQQTTTMFASFDGKQTLSSSAEFELVSKRGKTISVLAEVTAVDTMKLDPFVNGRILDVFITYTFNNNPNLQIKLGTSVSLYFTDMFTLKEQILDADDLNQTVITHEGEPTEFDINNQQGFSALCAPEVL
jgi:hypothetical protein